MSGASSSLCLRSSYDALGARFPLRDGVDLMSRRSRKSKRGNEHRHSMQVFILANRCIV